METGSANKVNKGGIGGWGEQGTAFVGMPKLSSLQHLALFSIIKVSHGLKPLNASRIFHILELAEAGGDRERGGHMWPAQCPTPHAQCGELYLKAQSPLPLASLEVLVPTSSAFKEPEVLPLYTFACRFEPNTKLSPASDHTEPRRLLGEAEQMPSALSAKGETKAR